jgi:putative ABC transport system substrate-binding protein
MKRRKIIALAGGAGMWPLVAGAQQKDLPLIGMLILGSKEDAQGSRPTAEAFDKALEGFGWIPGKTVRIESRWTAGDAAELERYAAELVALKPGVILANGTPSVVALKKVTKSIPIVFAGAQDPVGNGLVASLARPGGNITGFTYFNPELIGKWRGLLSEVAPSTKRAGLLFSPAINPQYYNNLRDLGPVPQGAIEVVASPVQTVETLRAAMAELGRTGSGAAIIPADAFMWVHSKEASSLALQYRLPTIAMFRKYVAEGGLMSYGPDINDIFRRSASYLDRILKGEKPAELPVQQPDKYELSINLRTAKALGLAVPPTLHALADEVIE